MSVRRFVLSDADAVALRAASIFREQSTAFVASRGRFTVAFSGGSTPLRFFEILSTAQDTDVHWDRTDIFWVDERCVPPENVDSNYKGLQDTLLSRVCIPPENVRRIKGELPPEAGAREYEDELLGLSGGSGFPEFDLVVLGVGQDGHTASLFPDAPSLSEQKRAAIPVYVERLQSWRITLTLPVLNNALHILFLVTGRNKAEIVRELLGDMGNRKKYPAGLVRPFHGEVTWLLDKEAASQLSS